MAVRGIGVDLVAIDGFAEQLRAVGSVFVEQTFTAVELRAADGPSGAAQHLAGRYAAKEAFVKAFSAAQLGRAPVLPDMDWREVEVRTDGWGRPFLALHGAMAAAVRSTLGPVVAHVSLTHEPAMASAFVVIEDAAGPG
jgi:holo-[acyl-carrier protein] synthase